MRKQSCILFLLGFLLMTAQPAIAQGSLGHSIQASKHGSQAGAHSAVGAAKLTSGIVAVPLIAIGEVGKAVGSTGEAMWDEANEPLPIASETVTAGPPPSVPSDKPVIENSSTLTSTGRE